MLGGDVMYTEGPNVGIRTDLVWLCLMGVADYKAPTWPVEDVPKQIHLDLAADYLDSAVAKAVRLGARPASKQLTPDEWRVMLDPAGHPGCLTTHIPSEVL